MKQVSVYKTDQGWGLTVRGFDTQEQAIEAGRDLARDLQAELTTHGEDGRIREKDSHGPDPKKIRG